MTDSLVSYRRYRGPYPLRNINLNISKAIEDYDHSLDVFIDKPFWIWNNKKHNLEYNRTNGQCCFNHLIGLPEKNNKQYPIFPFQHQIYNAIENNQNIWILKSRGIGITTFIIRYLASKILSSNQLDNKSIFIISGTREDHANYIKQKMQDLFIANYPNVQLQSKYTELWLKRTWIKVFPTKNIKDIRGYFESSYIWLDESDYLDQSVQDELFHAISPYEEKSNCKIILSSTPFRPDGLMQSIEKDGNSKYKKLKLDYTYGLGTIYNPIDIAKKKLDIEFDREYKCLYLGKIGNVFSPNLIDNAIKRYEQLGLRKIPAVYEALHLVGIDAGFGSSNTGVVVTEHLRNPDIIRVLYAEEFHHANPSDIVDLCYDFHRKYYPNVRFLVDGSNAGFVRQLKVVFGEDPEYSYQDVSPETMEILPVAFNVDHKSMLSHLYLLVNKGLIAIPKEHEKLIISLRTAQAKEYALDKEQTSYNDLFDACRLACKGFILS